MGIVKRHATEDYVDARLADLVDSAPETLDTLGELATAFKENEEVVDVLNQAITTKTDKTDTPFRFGIDENGNYGYIKAGADSVTPFKTIAKKVGTIVCGLSERTLDLSSVEDKDRITVDNFYLIPTSFVIIDSPVTGNTEGSITFGEYIIRKTYSNYIFRCRRDSIPGNVAVDLQCDVYVIY